MAELPILPDDWRLVVAESTSDQFANVRRVLQAPDVTGVICATDAGREGELIFRYIYEAARCKKPVRRLWISSLTPDAIARGFRDLRDGSEYDALARAARARSRADWLVGMNLSRAYSIAADEVFSVGRVQTPTLAMLVTRENEIRSFVPEDYFEVVATFRPSLASDETYAGTWFRGESRRLAKDGVEASAIALRVLTGEARIESVEREVRRLPPPLLYDLTELQRHANRLYGMSAARTLDVAQALYERRKLLSYPRTASRRLSRAIAETLPDVVRAIADPYRARMADGTGQRPLAARFVDDARVADHHAIIPTATRAPADLAGDERRIYDLVCRRLLAAWHDNHVYAVTKVVTRVTSGEVNRFASSGTSIEHLGWKALDVGEGKSKGDAPGLPGGLREGGAVDVVDAKAVEKQTRPFPRFTDATLLTAMETAGRGLPEKEIADAMRECGLGTPATRAAILEVLLKREYGTRREVPPGDRQGHRARRRRTRERQIARDDRRVGSAARAHRTRYGGLRHLHGGHRGVRARGGRERSRRGPTARCAGSPGLARRDGVASPDAGARGPDNLVSLLRERFGFSSYKPSPGRGMPGCDARARRAPRDAHGRRKVPLLSASPDWLVEAQRSSSARSSR